MSPSSVSAARRAARTGHKADRTNTAGECPVTAAPKSRDCPWTHVPWTYSIGRHTSGSRVLRLRRATRRKASRRSIMRLQVLGRLDRLRFPYGRTAERSSKTYFPLSWHDVRSIRRLRDCQAGVVDLLVAENFNLAGGRAAPTRSPRYLPRGAPSLLPAPPQPSSCTMIRSRWTSSRPNWIAAAALADATSGASTVPRISPLARSSTTAQA